MLTAIIIIIIRGFYKTPDERRLLKDYLLDKVHESRHSLSIDG